jgi:hemolysin activation/secretion protein
MARQFFIAAIVVSFLATAVFAQDAQRVAPKLPPANPPAQLQPPAPTSQPSGEQLIVDRLQGVVFVDSRDKIRPASDVRGIDVSQTPALESDRFRAGVSQYLGQPLTLARLNEICRLVVTYYRGIGRPVVDAIVPEQDVTDGTVQVLVLEGRVGQVRAEGNRFFPSRLFISAIREQSGDFISQSRLLGDVDWLNRNPFRRTDVILEPGAQLGQTDVILNTEDHFPFRAYAGYENTGTVSTGQDRWETGFNWGDAFGLDDQLNYQYTFNSAFQRFQAHSGSYVVPLPWRDILTVFGNWSTSEVETEPDVFQQGQSWQISARYEIPLAKFYGISNSFILGGDFKRSNTNAEFGGSSVYASDVNVVQFMLGYDASDSDRFGSTDASLEWYGSPGYIGSNDDREDYEGARIGADPQYTYARLTADRTTILPAQFSVLTKLEGQVGSGALLGSEQVGVGGLDSVRGYEEREGNGDNAVIFSNELHAPPINLFSIAHRKDQLIFLCFIDYGVAWDRDVQAGQFGRENFLGAGPGISYRLGPWLSIDYAYGWRIAAGDPTVHEAGRSHLRLLASFSY